MIYVYDRIIEPFESQITRYGTTYKLENKTKMGDKTLYTFCAPERESLLVVPHFAKQYHEVEKFCEKYFFCKKLETCKVHIRRDINNFIKVEKMPNSESSTGIMHVIAADYKDIRVEFNYMNNRLSLSPEFEIISNNIFGNGVRVTMGLHDN